MIDTCLESCILFKNAGGPKKKAERGSQWGFGRRSAGLKQHKWGDHSFGGFAVRAAAASVLGHI